MKKLLLITTMIMAMNTWSADYQICSSYNEKARTHLVDTLEKCVKRWLNMGYTPIGSIGILPDGGVFQAVYKR